MLARDYATKRKAFGKYLADHPLHMKTMADMEVKGVWSNSYIWLYVFHR